MSLHSAATLQQINGVATELMSMLSSLKSAISVQVQRNSSSSATQALEQARVVGSEATATSLRPAFPRPTSSSRTTDFVHDATGSVLSVLTNPMNANQLAATLRTAARLRLRQHVNQRRHLSFSRNIKAEQLENQLRVDPNNASKHAELLKELNKTDPAAAIQRYESGRYAVNEACAQEYLLALSRTNNLHKAVPFFMQGQVGLGAAVDATGLAAGRSSVTSPYLNDVMVPGARASVASSAQPTAPSQFVNLTASPRQRLAMQEAQAPSVGTQTTFSSVTNPLMGASTAAVSSGPGSVQQPIHVIMQEPSFRSQLWRGIRTLAMALLVVSGVATLLEDRALGGPLSGGGRGPGAGMSIHGEIDPTTAAPSAAGSGKATVKFADVQGVDEAKQELEEIVEFLRDPQKFTRLGGKLPKGVLLMGPPGTGKTLLARAIAGEAGVPFLFASGSEFDEMFVGVGARRIRELFHAAKRKAPCIVFIDEIDAIGGARNPQNQQQIKMTLNQLLVELDGFSSSEGIIVIAATNYPESLDKALVRPGRFDRHVVVPLPDVRGRLQILNVHVSSRHVPLAPDVDLEVIARGTPGFSGAELANLINLAALRASMDNTNQVTMQHLEMARDRIIMGAERKSAVIDESNRRIVAFHEAGHALVALHSPGAMPVHKATIMPRGSALGMVAQLPEKDELSWTKKQLLARLDVAMGGRVAEELIFGVDDITSGASSDIESATRIAQAMVTKYGMSSKVGPILFKDEDMTKLSAETRHQIEQEVRILLEESKNRATNILKTHRDEHQRLAQALLEYETLSLEEIELVLKGKPLSRDRLPANTQIPSLATTPATLAASAVPSSDKPSSTATTAA